LPRLRADIEGAKLEKLNQYKDVIDADYQPIYPNIDNTIAGQLAKYQPESAIAAREFMRDLPAQVQKPEMLVHFTELIDKEKYQEAREWKTAITNYVVNNHTTNTTNSHNITYNVHYSPTYNITRNTTHNHPQQAIQQLPYTPPQPTYSTVDSRSYDHCISINNSGDNNRITATSIHVEGGGILVFVVLVLGFIGLGIAANS
jgi:hypothetical protein